MAKNIGSCKQNGSNQVYVYDEKGNYMFSLSGVLIGFTSTTITVKSGSSTYLYNEKGQYIRAI